MWGREKYQFWDGGKYNPCSKMIEGSGIERRNSPFTLVSSHGFAQLPVRLVRLTTSQAEPFHEPCKIGKSSMFSVKLRNHYNKIF